MKRIAALLVLALGASCSGLRPAGNTPPIASGTSSDPAAAAADLVERGVIGGESSELNTAESERTEPEVPDNPVDPMKRVRFIELTVDQTDPNSRKQLAKYLLNLNKYHIVQVKQLDARMKYWKFMVVETRATNARPQLNLPIEVELDQ